MILVEGVVRLMVQHAVDHMVVFEIDAEAAVVPAGDRRLADRGMFFVGILPALLVIYVRSHVPESPAWKRQRTQPRPGLLAALIRCTR